MARRAGNPQHCRLPYNIRHDDIVSFPHGAEKNARVSHFLRRAECENAMKHFAPRCLALDLEIGKKDGRIHAIGAARGDQPERTLLRFPGDLQAALRELDELAEGAAFLLGHNIIRFDLEHLKSVAPNLAFLKLPVVDTLRLNPLAFPRNPYHHLVKHHQEGLLKRERLNDPLQDAQLALQVFQDQRDALRKLQKTHPERLLIWHWLATSNAPLDAGLNSFFMTLRETSRPGENEAFAAMRAELKDKVCRTHLEEVLAPEVLQPWPLAFALAWLSVADDLTSVMPPWVRHNFPEAAALTRRLRDQACGAPDCHWCRERHDAQKELKHWFGWDAFRPEPKSADGVTPMQRSIVEAALKGEHVLGILPTGTGKSLCYQIPALSRFEKTGALTVVISPLVALMADQVAGLEAKQIHCCAALNGLLSLPERAETLERVRLGEIGILLVSPEQLRNRGFRRTLEQREIAAWVLDEAHCLSKWGHDFRPDYRYVGRFIRERAKAGQCPPPPVLCLTATAKPEVKTDIVTYFTDSLGIALNCFDGGAARENLDFGVVPTTPAEKLVHIHTLLEKEICRDGHSGAIIYCATRRNTEEVAGFLQQKDWRAACYHAGLSPETKKTRQQDFIAGKLEVIAATNAFGMGIDKPDVRLVIHADIPGSLENYVQEAGRAGRDREHARCVLLYAIDDVERQFGMNARSQLKRRDIQAILRALRHLACKKRREEAIVATPGEILLEEESGSFQRDSATDDTRVRTAIAWLEEAKLLRREENEVRVFPSSLRVKSVEDAHERLRQRTTLPSGYRKSLLAIVERLFNTSADEGVSTDELMGVAGLTPGKLRKALHDLETLGLASNDTSLTAYVHAAVEHSSKKRLSAAIQLEKALIACLREQHPDMAKGEKASLHLRRVCQSLKDKGYPDALPERVGRLLNGLAADGRGEEGGDGNGGSIRLKRLDGETLDLALQREWRALEKTAQRREDASGILLEHLLACLPKDAKGLDILVETTLGKLTQAMQADMTLKGDMKDPQKLLDHALLWLHQQEIIRLNKGLTVFRSAMTLYLDPDWEKKFAAGDFEPLRIHYDGQKNQIHVMARYAELGLETIKHAHDMAQEYFRNQWDEFIAKWMPGLEKAMERPMTAVSWQGIVESLGNKTQQNIVTGDRKDGNALVLAGPGSGKTRVLAHRIAYLVRGQREKPESIIALAYNRHAAAQIRARLQHLIGEDARHVTVLTLHALAMRLVGASLLERQIEKNDDVFKKIIDDAVRLLQGKGLPPEMADAQRDRLLAGFRWVLVDEYQDMREEQYNLIAALSGRAKTEADERITLFAVGDDDQNIYAYDGASVEFIRRYETDYKAKLSYLTENYRSTAHIIAAANLVIAPIPNRMKAKRPIRVDAARAREAAGGSWQKRDAVGQGRVQILPAGVNDLTQAMSVMTEFTRLAGLDSDWDWGRCAVIAREWKNLAPVRAWCELHGVPAQEADEKPGNFWRLRETQTLCSALGQDGNRLIRAATITRHLLKWMPPDSPNPWWASLQEAVAEYAQEIGEAELPLAHFREWLVEWGREARQRQTGLLLTTAHKAKGLEFNHVAVLDGNWDRINAGEDPDSPRRLYYVAMTRARHTLMLSRLQSGNPLLDALPEADAILRRLPIALPPPPAELRRHYLRLTAAEVDMDWAGSRHAHAGGRAAISHLEIGCPLELIEKVSGKTRQWVLTNTHGAIVGKLAQKFVFPKATRCIAAQARSIHVRVLTDVAEEYKTRLQPGLERWEYVLPELVLMPSETKGGLV
jgi:ATP-dependent DNA helicase RecQ